MSIFKRSPSESPLNYGVIPPEMPAPIRQRSPMSSKQFLSPSSVDADPFYLLKEPPAPGSSAVVTGETHMISHYGLEHSYNRFTTKKLRDQLSAFLPHLPGNIDMMGSQDNGSLQSVIEKPPINKEINPFTSSLLQGFKLHPGSIPEQYKLLHHQPTKKHKQKRNKRDHRIPELNEPMSAEGGAGSPHEKKHKKTKKHGDQDGEKKKRDKKKRDKKKKKARQVPMHPGMPTPQEGSGPGRP